MNFAITKFLHYRTPGIGVQEVKDAFWAIFWQDIALGKKLLSFSEIANCGPFAWHQLEKHPGRLHPQMQ